MYIPRWCMPVQRWVCILTSHVDRWAVASEIALVSSRGWSVRIGAKQTSRTTLHLPIAILVLARRLNRMYRYLGLERRYEVSEGGVSIGFRASRCLSRLRYSITIPSSSHFVAPELYCECCRRKHNLATTQWLLSGRRPTRKRSASLAKTVLRSTPSPLLAVDLDVDISSFFPTSSQSHGMLAISAHLSRLYAPSPAGGALPIGCLGWRHAMAGLPLLPDL